MIPKYISNLNMSLLYQALANLPTKVDAGNVYMAYDQYTDPRITTVHPYVRKAIEEIETITKGKAIGMMVNTLKAKSSSPIHTDPGEGDRYHLPITTNTQTNWWDEINGLVHFMSGYWYGPVPYRFKHQVFNDGKTDRLHLIIDLK